MDRDLTWRLASTRRKELFTGEGGGQPVVGE
jgi:hypothetical protein